ncbi:unnamed protein product [Nippostrongylus brasiliensis]|uniref:Palmitoyltransferase (inferred by orthology to a C. elegans protein) n=1 Tax=Nippostrongylus brasiliensis TaxID=27835 RepID=A0A0N4Y1S7_NIPBR|nr:unnamed protein product [Nippostrongylus brasiliensis]
MSRIALIFSVHVALFQTMLTDPGSVPKGNATEEHIERLQAAEDLCFALDGSGTAAIFLMFEAILFAIFTSVMFGTQVSAICSDETAIETLKRGAEDRQKAGSWKKNMQSVFGGPCSMRWLNPLIEPYVSKPACEYSV